MNRPVHRCEDRECPVFGQATSSSCRCHKTTEQMLIEQRDELLTALKAVMAFIKVDSRYDGVVEMQTARWLIAKVEAA